MSSPSMFSPPDVLPVKLGSISPTAALDFDCPILSAGFVLVGIVFFDYLAHFAAGNITCIPPFLEINHHLFST